MPRKVCTPDEAVIVAGAAFSLIQEALVEHMEVLTSADAEVLSDVGVQQIRDWADLGLRALQGKDIPTHVIDTARASVRTRRAIDTLNDMGERMPLWVDEVDELLRKRNLPEDKE